MTCAQARRLIMDLDAHETPGPGLADHLNVCPDCRRYYERLRRVEASASLASSAPHPDGDEPLPAASDFTDRVMRAVAEEAATNRSIDAAADPRPVGLRGWTVGGALILAGLVSIEFSDVVEWLRAAFGSVIDVALGTMLGIALTIYIMLLVGLNLRAVRRFLRPRIR